MSDHLLKKQAEEALMNGWQSVGVAISFIGLAACPNRRGRGAIGPKLRGRGANDRQLPWDHSSLIGEFYFKRGG